MRHLSMFSILALLPLVTGACSDTAEARRTQTEAKEAWEAAKDWTQTQWSQFVGESEKRLTDLKQELADLKESARAKGSEAEQKLAEVRDDLDRKVSEAAAELEGLKGRAKDAWQDAARRADNALDELKRGLERGWNKVKGEAAGNKDG